MNKSTNHDGCAGDAKEAARHWRTISTRTIALDIDMHEIFRGLKFITRYLDLELTQQSLNEPVEDLEIIQHATATACMLTDILYQISCDIQDAPTGKAASGNGGAA